MVARRVAGPGVLPRLAAAITGAVAIVPAIALSIVLAIALAITLAIALAVAAPPPAHAHPTGAAETYRWVERPDWSTQDAPAEGRHERVEPSVLEAGAATVWTPDFQAVVSLAVNPPVTTPATVIITPLAPSTLPPPPGGHANGNAYHVRVDAAGWEPASVQVALSTPFEATGMVALVGESWQPLPMERGALHVVAPASSDMVVLAIADRVDGHDSWWDALVHDRWRVALLVAAILAVGGRWWMARPARVRSASRPSGPRRRAASPSGHPRRR